MEKLLSGDFPFYRFRNLSAYPELMHFVSSGVKNIGFSDRENPEIIQHNRRSLAEAAGFEVERLITARQVHSATVRIVTAEEAGRGALDRESRIPATDALVTNQPGICLMVLSADCVPVLLFEPEKRVVAAVHAGWRGTAARYSRGNRAGDAGKFRMRSPTGSGGYWPLDREMLFRSRRGSGPGVSTVISR